MCGPLSSTLCRLPSAVSWSGRRESNPRPTAWKAVTLPLSYSRIRRSAPRQSSIGNRKSKCLSQALLDFRLPIPDSRPSSTGGQGRIRTSVARSAADLQSAAINHSATCPRAKKTGDFEPPVLPCPALASIRSLEPAMGVEPATFRLQIGCSTVELRRQSRLRELLPGSGLLPAFKERTGPSSANREV